MGAFVNVATLLAQVNRSFPKRQDPLSLRRIDVLFDNREQSQTAGAPPESWKVSRRLSEGAFCYTLAAWILNAAMSFGKGSQDSSGRTPTPAIRS
jgi:hypothetical protein